LKKALAAAREFSFRAFASLMRAISCSDGEHREILADLVPAHDLARFIGEGIEGHGILLFNGWSST
jgi:hypothetical protein